MAFFTKQLQFSPVRISDDDELIQAIENEGVTKDNQWDLTEQADAMQLNEYWAEVQEMPAATSLQKKRKKV